MPSNGKATSRKQLMLVLLAAVICGGAAARIIFFFWKTAHADAASKKAIEYREQHRLDWMNQYLALAPPTPRASDQHPCVYQSMTPRMPRPRVGECRTGWSLFYDPLDQFEVDLRYGAFVVRQTDLFINDSFPVPFTRAYTSHDWFDPNPVHAFGRNANHTYDISPLGGKPLFTSLSLALEDGDFIFFDRISPGENYSDGLYRHSETEGRFYKAFIYWNGSGWTTKLADGLQVLFPDSSGAKKISDGAATEIDDASGNKLVLERDSGRNLRQIVTPHDHSIRLLYDERGSIARAEDDRGNWAAYSYNGDGMLTNVVSSSGQKRRYEYDGADLTVVRDEEGNLLVRNFYAQHTVIAQQFANGDVYQYSYNLSPNSKYADSVDIRFPDGRVETVQTGASVPDLVRRIKTQSAN